MKTTATTTERILKKAKPTKMITSCDELNDANLIEGTHYMIENSLDCSQGFDDGIMIGTGKKRKEEGDAVHIVCNNDASIMGGLSKNAQATINIMGNVVVENCNFYGRIVVYGKHMSGYVFGPLVDVTFNALSYAAVDLQYNGYLDNIAIIVGATVPADLGISVMNSK